MSIDSNIKMKNIIIMLVVLVIGCLAVCGIVYYDVDKINELDVTECKLTDTVEWDIDKVEVSDSLLISGWALIPGEKITSADYSVVLYDGESDKYLALPTQCDGRTDMNSRFTDGIDYFCTGFLSRVSLRKLDLNNKEYKIFINYKNNGYNYLIDTNQYVKGN